MKSFSERAKAIKEALQGKERFADILNNIGIEVNRTFKFSLREERTPSIQIYNSGDAYDFGSGENMDMIDIVMYHKSLSKVDALELVEDLLGIDNSGQVTYEFKTPVCTNSVREGEYDETPMRESYTQYFQNLLARNRNKAQKHLDKLMPRASIEVQNEMIKHFEMGYDLKNDKITMPVRSVKDNHIMNLMKYSSDPGLFEDGSVKPKVKYIYGRRRTLFNLSVLKTAPKVLYIFEGEKDVINATINGKAAITQGAASGWKDWMSQAIKKACEHYNVAIPKFVILQDNDKPGVLATLKIYNDLKELSEAKMFFWKEDIVKKLSSCQKILPYKNDLALMKTPLNVQEIKKGFDYTDYIEAIA